VEEKKKELSPELQKELDELFEEIAEKTDDPEKLKEMKKQAEEWGAEFQEAYEAQERGASKEEMEKLCENLFGNMPEFLKEDCLDEEDGNMLKEMGRAREEDEKSVRDEMNLQINHLPDSLQEQFVALNIDPLKLFVALRGTALLAFRYQRHCGCKKGLIYLEECGNISFENHKSFIPATTTIHEMRSYAGVDEDTAKKLLTWTCYAAMYWPKIIPELKVAAVHMIDGELKLSLEEDKK